MARVAANCLNQLLAENSTRVQQCVPEAPFYESQVMPCERKTHAADGECEKYLNHDVLLCLLMRWSLERWV